MHMVEKYLIFPDFGLMSDLDSHMHVKTERASNTLADEYFGFRAPPPTKVL